MTRRRVLPKNMPDFSFRAPCYAIIDDEALKFEPIVVVLWDTLVYYLEGLF